MRSNAMSLPSFADESGRCEESRDRTHGRLSSYFMPPDRLLLWNPSYFKMTMMDTRHLFL